MRNSTQADALIFVQHQHVVDVFIGDWFFVVFAFVLSLSSSSHLTPSVTTTIQTLTNPSISGESDNAGQCSQL